MRRSQRCTICERAFASLWEVSSTSYAVTVWLPIKGRPPTCRADGCNVPALDDELRLCEECGWWQPSRQHQQPQKAPRAVAEALPRLELAPAWAKYAACRGMGPETFFSDEPAAVAQAKAICLACPVRRGCLEVALVRPALVGIWGALDEAERRELARRRQRAA